MPIDPIVGRLRDSLVALGGARPALLQVADSEVFEGASRRMDPGHAVVLRGLLDTDEPPRSEGHPDLLASLSARFAALQNDCTDRLEVIRRELPERIGEEVLGKRFQDAGFYKADPWSTTGRGSRKDLRVVYLSAYREILAECERILVQCQSRCDHLDELAAKQWLGQPMDNGPRQGACLAEGLRPTESERLKAWRGTLSKNAEDAFCTALTGRWEKLTASSRFALHQIAARPWASSQEDGFRGFAQRMLDHAQALVAAMVWLSRSRWELHLRPLRVENNGD